MAKKRNNKKLTKHKVKYQFPSIKFPTIKLPSFSLTVPSSEFVRAQINSYHVQIIAIVFLTILCLEYSFRASSFASTFEIDNQSSPQNIPNHDDLQELYPSPTYNITKSSIIQTERIRKIRGFCKFGQEPQDSNLLPQNKEYFHYLTRSNKTDEFRLIEETRSKSLFCEIPKAGSTVH